MATLLTAPMKALGSVPQCQQHHPQAAHGREDYPCKGGQQNIYPADISAPHPPCSVHSAAHAWSAAASAPLVPLLLNHPGSVHSAAHALSAAASAPLVPLLLNHPGSAYGAAHALSAAASAPLMPLLP